MRLIAALLCLAVWTNHVAGAGVAAFICFCVHWATSKENPDSPFAVVAWPVWYLTGFCAAAFLIYYVGDSMLYADPSSLPWAACAAAVLYEFYFLPLQRRGAAEWAARIDQCSQEQAEGDWEAAGRSAHAAYQAAKRIRWAGQEPRALAALMLAEARLHENDAAGAEKLCTEALPAFERARQINGVPLDQVYYFRGLARARQHKETAIEDLEAGVSIRRAWAGDDKVVEQMLLLKAEAQTAAFDRAGDAPRDSEPGF